MFKDASSTCFLISSRTGRLIKPTGSKYDAHHIQPLENNGGNIWQNITPARYPDWIDNMFERIKNSSIIVNNFDEYSLCQEKNLFFKLPDSDFLELEKHIQIPYDLFCFWKEIGYGFLTVNESGSIRSESDNRIMDPLSILDILVGESEQVSSNFVIEPYQVPFFERFSEYFICFDRRNLNKPKQPVYWIWDMENPLADSIESFIYKLFENPDFLNEI
ncbi:MULTISPECIES: hypothetical protein [Neisseria]|uniref:Knr4/Smi1-like domain-containing protein n=3 Tax=Neisseria lactamica TaxID=486 RepID=A0A378VKF3_NEILA|nr:MULTISPECIES: hypothetical protein [Neisseria]KFJ37225.1 putative identified by MetaGeneAnnotator [Neisseria lactamica ATCC 23970]SUA16570.1 Uncharacterised protein [Neisseria lactamica]VTQ47536.1 Uncharacterised protein [Neisseria lactamica]VTQ49522.1 Uncharacterised protein [Neisseria lactamica]